MAYAERETVEIQTDDSGDAVATTTKAFTGRLLSIQYVKDDFADGVDFDIEAEETGETLWAEDNVNAAKTVRPRAPVHDTDGDPLLYADSGEPVTDHIWLVHDRVKITVENGGEVRHGKFIVTVG